MKSSLQEIIKEKGGVIHKVALEATVADAVVKMNAERIGSVIVMDGDKMMGIFTERDVLTKIVSCNCDPAQTPVADVMTRDLLTLAPSASIEEAMRVVIERHIRHLPVIEGDKLLGMVSSGDLTRWILRDQEETIKDLYTYISQ